MNGAIRRQIMALALSGIFPGLGQFYNREPWKGAAFLVGSAVPLWLARRAVPEDLLALDPLDMFLIAPLGVLLAIWLWSLIDAWLAARR